MIDVIQRSGLQYYFGEEIQTTLARHHAEVSTLGYGCTTELHKVALLFRFLRQQGYNVPSDIFNKFKDSNGKFKHEICNDTKGLLSLFEASQLSIDQEEIMDEAGCFSEQLLKTKTSLTNSFKEPNATTIKDIVLKNPFHKTFNLIMAKSFLQNFDFLVRVLHDSRYVEDWMKEVQYLGKIEAAVTQDLHRNELLQISRWGKQLNSCKTLKFARFQPFKWYMWSLGALPGPNMSEARIDLAKSVAFMYIIDDIYDIYGTIDELALFTEAINRWDDADINQLPEYMRVCFKDLYDMVNETSLEISRKHGWNPKDSLRTSWTDLCTAFFTEAKWCASTSSQLPSSAEYIKNGIVSVAGPMILTHAFFLSGEEINKKRVEALNNLPSVVSSTAMIFRLWNDMGSDRDENRDDKDMSYIECYMKEHNLSSVGIAKQQANRMISNAWKQLNEEWLSSTSPFSSNFKAACLNFARMVPVVYNRDHSHHLMSLQQHLNMSLNDNLN